ncbi:MAG: HEPN domain-containing protein [Methanosarcinales archaeon]|nr:MAG: HEPN domain-containing protein [Methanosarcinales archaeon]
MQQNKLVELTPDKWGLLVYLNEHDAVDLTTIKRFMNDIAESRLTLAEDNLSVAEKLLEIGLSNRTVIHKSYYSMYHAARSAVYVQMQLDVKEHRTLVGRFKKLLTRQFGDGTLARQMNNWRTERIKCDYDIGVKVRDVVCESAISDASMIINTSKNLVEEF